MVLVDYAAEQAQVTVIHPRDETLLSCELKQFSPDQIIALNERMTKPMRDGNYGRTGVDVRRLALMKLQLGM